MGSIVAGGHEELRMNPSMFHIQESITPLIHDDNGLKELMICAEKNFPIVYAPMPMAGTTAPATFAGALALSLARDFGRAGDSSANKTRSAHRHRRRCVGLWI